ncbi:hypothetical protein E1287_41590, partial [Actinomadura sp. KC06]|uniref:SAM-dependent methyltransferase n=1 Tax=Actinomadura sp. KC06 TaxID=2530369 RepID=UPI0010F38D97
MPTPEDNKKDRATQPEKITAEEFLTTEGQMRFLGKFLPVRSEVIYDFYHTSRDGHKTKRSITRNFRAAIRLVVGGFNETVPELYRLYYNRLFSTIWLALNWGPYTQEIKKLPDPQLRIYISQINSVDLCWQPAVENAPEGGLFVEVGTGLSDGWARIASLKPHARIVSITFERDQAEIARRIAKKLGLADRVTIRTGDIFDPATTRDLIGVADAVTAMGVIAHFPPQRKAEGLRKFAALPKPAP